jgi:uncharacterized membrane protein
MDFSFLVIVGLLFIFGPYIVAIWLASRISRAERAARSAEVLVRDLQGASAAQAGEIAALRREIRALQGIAPEEQGITPAEVAPFASVEAALPQAAPAEEVVAAADAPAIEEAVLPSASGWASRLGGWLRGGGLERQFGAVLPVWIGGIALAFAGFFLVKYSIENNLLGPTARVVLGGLLGAALLVGAHWVGYRVRVESAERIAQSLAGAGIAVLYVSVYAASTLYDLVPPLIGFLGMALVTAIAVVLSLRHGPPIALLGLLGGFLTPALIRSSEPSAMLLFIYLYLVFAALIVLVRRKNWWPLALPAVLLSFLWVAVWLMSDAFRPDQVLWAGLFLGGVAGTIVAASRERYSAEMAAAGSWRDLFSLRNRAFFLNTVALAGSFALFAVLAFQAEFGAADWVLFGVLAMGAVALAYFDAPLYGYVPWAAMAVNLAMLAGWEPDTLREIAVAVGTFGALYVASGLLLFRSARYPLLWAALAVISAIGYYLLVYFRLTGDAVAGEPEIVPVPIPEIPPPVTNVQPESQVIPPAAAPTPITPPVIDTPPSTQPVEPLVQGAREAAQSIPHVWGVIAFALALIFFGAALRAVKTLAPSPSKDRVLAAFALGTTAFVALGFFVELQREFLSVAIAAELLAVVWVAGRTQIVSLRAIAALLGLVFAFLLLPQILLIIQLAIYSLFDWPLYLQGTIPLVEYPLFQLALPAAMFLLGAFLLRKQTDSWLVRSLEGAAVALIGLWGYYTASKLFHPVETVLFAEAGFLERGVITNVLFVYGLACLIVGRVFGRRAFAFSGRLLVFTALFRIVYFDLLIKNPLWFHTLVPGVSIMNALAITFGLPILWTWIAAREEALSPRPWLARFAKRMPVLMLIFAFAWLSLEIRRNFQGPFLDGGGMSDAELYSYSLAWLAFGLGLLFFGTLNASQMLRFASLAVMLATVSKVFLIDASSLTGLFRVFSFLGLGLCLIGLSYFYSRFVFAEADGEASPQA